MLVVHICAAVTLGIFTIVGGIYVSRRIKRISQNKKVYEQMEKHNDKY